MRIIRKEITIKAPVEKVWRHLKALNAATGDRKPKKVANWRITTKLH